MNALLKKNSLVLWLFLLVGLFLLTIQAFHIGFNDAFVFPRFGAMDARRGHRSSDNFLIGITYALLGCLLGWVAGSMDRIRGMTDYLYHRPLTKARIYFGQLVWFGLLLLVLMVLPWVLVALFSSGSYPPDYLRVGLPRVLAGAICFPCFAMGFFLAQLRLNVALRVLMTFPLLFMLLGRSPEAWLSVTLVEIPMLSAAYNMVWAGLFLCGSWAAFLSRTDSDLPPSLGTLASFGILILTLALPWQAIVRSYSNVIQVVSHRRFIAVDDSGDYYIAATRSHDSNEALDLLSLASNSESFGSSLRSFKIDPQSHQLLEAIENPTRVPVRIPEEYKLLLHNNWMPQDRNTAVQTGARGISVLSYANHIKGKVSHYVKLENGEHRRFDLDRGGSPFSEDLQIHSGSDQVVWVGDRFHNSVWYVDLWETAPTYRQVELPAEFGFDRWTEPYGSLANRLRHNIRKDGRFFYVLCKGHHATINRDTATSRLLTDVEENWIVESASEIVALNRKQGVGETVQTKDLGWFGYRTEVRNEQDQTLFTHDFVATSPWEKRLVATRLCLSALSIPILKPGAFGATKHTYIAPVLGLTTALSYNKYIRHESDGNFWTAWIGPWPTFWNLPYW
ncbi:MAG: hypothetical protein ACI87O_002614, partial [Planctomycetota bacterium]